MNIIKPSVSMRLKYSHDSSLETECLFGETVEPLEEHLDWVYCKLITDNYHGWIKKSGLGHLKKATHRVFVKRTFIYKKRNEKSNCVQYLPMGAQLHVNNIKFDWAEIHFLIKNTEQIGYVPLKHIVPLNHKTKNWVKKAEELIGIPYKWGGRDSLGLDCSALLQIAYQTYGKTLPRNTVDQVMIPKKPVENFNCIERGCVIFWKGHVGIMASKTNCIHSNAFHMQVTKEPLINIIERTNKENSIIKIINFN